MALPSAIVCAPVGRALAADALPRLRERHTVRVVDRSHFRDFVGDSYDTPETLGLDRILNLAGMKGDGVAISCGTAITVDAVASGRPSWGGIMPGFRTAAEGLHARIPALPVASLDAVPELPARSSVASVVNGVLLGTALAAASLARLLARDLFGSSPPRIVITGGDARLLARLWSGGEEVVVDDALLFRGMMGV